MLTIQALVSAGQAPVAMERLRALAVELGCPPAQVRVSAIWQGEGEVQVDVRCAAPVPTRVPEGQPR